MSCHNASSTSDTLANKIDGIIDSAQARASAPLPAEADKTPSPASSTDTIKVNQGLAIKNLALAVVIQEIKSREERIDYWYKELEKANIALYASIREQHYQIKDLEARLENNQAKLIDELQNTITTLEGDVDEAAWTEAGLVNEIKLLKEQLKGIYYGLHDKISRLNRAVGSLQYQINAMQACRSEMDIDMDISLSKEAASESQCQIDIMQAGPPGEKSEDLHTKEKISGNPGSGGESDDNLSLFPSSDDE
jgi:hypothetical protein